LKQRKKNRKQEEEGRKKEGQIDIKEERKTIN
jgi:hypothetical protein